jgi:hypothetical protein
MAKADLNVNSDWTLAQTLFGVTTYYRREDNGSLSIKLEGQLEGVALFEQVAVLREVDLHSKWAPFCSSSLTVAHLDKLDTVGWFAVGLPNFGLMRDGCFRAIGCDSIAEDGSILLVAQGIADRAVDKQDKTTSAAGKETKKTTITNSNNNNTVDDQYLARDSILDQLDLPEVPTRMGAGRMTIRKFSAVIHVLSPTSVQTKLIANINPNLSFFPQSLLDFLMKKLCGVLLHKLQTAAKKIAANPIHNPHSHKMRAESEFYQTWLMGKFAAICVARGWTMPSCAAFELTDEQLEQSAMAEEKNSSHNKQKTKKTLRHAASNPTAVLRQEQNPHQTNPTTVRALSTMSEPPYVGQLSPTHTPNNHNLSSRADSDDISELSLSSSSTRSSVWKNNPVATYLRDLEEKTELRKANEIAMSRDRASARLKPKTLEANQQSRLDELRVAKEKRRMDNVDTQRQLDNKNNAIAIPADATKSQRKLLKSKSKADWATMWTRHGTFMRMFVIQTLFAILFVLLYTESFFGILPTLQVLIHQCYEFFGMEGQQLQEQLQEQHQYQQPWYMGTARGVGTVVFMGVAAFAHFALCFVALIYTFSSLQLGRIAGRQARKFYVENVHILVASASGSMVVLGIVKALLVVLIRNVLWRTLQVWGLVKEYVIEKPNPIPSDRLALLIPDLVQPWLVDILLPMVIRTYSFVIGAISLLLSGIHALMVVSNSVGRVVESIVMSVIGSIVSSYNQWEFYIQSIADQMEGRSELPSWREDAFGTTRALLSYSAVFLLTLLILFNLSARHARGPAERTDSEGDGAAVPENSSLDQTPVSSLQSQVNVSEPPNDDTNDNKVSQISIPRSTPKYPNSRSRSTSPQFDTIQEEGPTSNEAAAENDQLLAPTESALDKKLESSPEKRRKGLFRFRKKQGEVGGSVTKPKARRKRTSNSSY